MKFDIPEGAEVPDSFKAYVKDTDGKKTLDVTGWETPTEMRGMKSTVVNLRGQVEEWSKYGKPADVQAQIDALTEKANGNGKGADDAQTKLDAMSLDYEGKLTARDERITKMMTRGASSDLKAELAKAGFVAEAIDDIASSAMNRLQFNEDGSPKVMTFDGKPMIGNGADHGATLADLAKELAEAKPYAVRSNMLPGGGKPPGPNGGKPNTPTMNRTQFNALERSDQSEYLRSGGKLTD